MPHLCKLSPHRELSGNRRQTLLAAALTAVAALSLSACGGGDDTSEGNDKIAGADTGGATSASPSKWPLRASDRPEIKLPSDLTMTFEDGKTGDPDKDAVLADSADRMRATNAAIAGTDPNLGITGTIRYYNRTVTLEGSETASLVFRADESKGCAKDLKTDKPKVTTPSDEDFILYNTRLEKSDDGIWQTTRIVSTAGAKQCLK